MFPYKMWKHFTILKKIKKDFPPQSLYSRNVGNLVQPLNICWRLWHFRDAKLRHPSVNTDVTLNIWLSHPSLLSYISHNSMDSALDIPTVLSFNLIIAFIIRAHVIQFCSCHFHLGCKSLQHGPPHSSLYIRSQNYHFCKKSYCLQTVNKLHVNRV